MVLGRWCRQEDVVVGLPYSGRTHAQLEGLVGNFINMLPIRASLSAGTSFAALLKQVQQGITDALGHAELPFNKLVEAMGVSRSASRTPIFQAVVDLLEDPASDQQPSFVQGPVEPTVCRRLPPFICRTPGCCASVGCRRVSVRFSCVA